MRKLDYEQIIKTIETTHRFGNKTGVEITADILEKMGYSDNKIPYIHVAGTNGKGSTCAFLGSILQEANLKVGIFTSPHLIDFEERIAINGVNISKEDVTRIGNIILDTEFDVTPTYFDYCLAIAIVYFNEQKCDAMVIETGLGGRLDSTNAIGVPEVSVITKIGYDHVGILGNTLELIASEKAGIIKQGSSVVIEKQEPEVCGVLNNKLIDERISEYSIVTDEDIECAKSIGLRISGVHQYENAAAAMLAARYFLVKRGYTHSSIDNCIRNGISKATWAGRMEIVCNEPFIMVDGAHNSHGVHALKESLMELYPNQKFSFYMAVMADKDYPDMIDEMLPLVSDFTAVTIENERAAQADELALCIKDKGIDVACINGVEALVEFLKNSNKNENKNIVFGSLYFIGEVKQYFKNGGFLNEKYNQNI